MEKLQAVTRESQKRGTAVKVFFSSVGIMITPVVRFESRYRGKSLTPIQGSHRKIVCQLLQLAWFCYSLLVSVRLESLFNCYSYICK